MPRTHSSTFVVSLFLLPLLGGVGGLGCRPSQAEFDAVKAELTQVRAEQEKTEERLLRLENNGAYNGDRDLAERTQLREGLIDVAGRVSALEEAKVEIEKKRPSAPNRPDPTATYRVDIGDSHTKGSPRALVTIVMWTDYQCPYCGRAQDTMDQLEKEYGDDLRFVHKHNPLGFHPNAMPAALAAEAAGRQGKFWKMHARMFDNQKKLGEDDLRKHAKSIGLNIKKYKADIKDAKLKERVQQEQAQGMKLGARGTPAFFVNGRFLSGAQPVHVFRELIDEELAEAKELVGAGVPRAKVYEAVVAEGKTQP